MDSTKEIVKEFEKELINAIAAAMVSRGIEKNSDLIKTLEVKPLPEGFALITNNYYEYVDKGRKRGVKKVPISDLIKWMKDKGIRTKNMNSTAFAIQTAIYKNGIKGKNFGNEVEEVVADLTEIKLADGFEDSLLNEIDKYL